MPLHFLLDDPIAARPGEAVTLTGAEAHHAATVRRVRVGEDVTVGDGRGAWLVGSVESVASREVVVRIDERMDAPAPRPRIVPWQAARSVSRWDAAKAAKGRSRWAAIVREAGKQAHRAWLPEVAELASTKDLARRAASSRTFVLEPTARERLSAVRLDTDGERDVILVVGPEGGIAADELSSLEQAGARLVRLGDTVLRTSTAGPAALAVVSIALGRW
jgi:16S rRNA (uracil1498-N3)-methyltransferase